MSAIFATVAVVCTMSSCNDYVIDTSQTLKDGVVNTQSHKEDFLSKWDDEDTLTKWLGEYKVGETVFEIVSLEFETQEIEQDDIP